MRNRWTIFAFTTLGLVFAGMSLFLVLHPERTGVVPNYRYASSHWWASADMYTPGTHGFLYAPSFAVLFTPFERIHPNVLGEVIWRMFGFSLFAWALWKLFSSTHGVGRLQGNSIAYFLIVLLAVPASLASLSNGQTNLSLSALVLLGALSLRDENWKAAAFYLCGALIIKPIALAPWLLAFTVFAPVRGYLLVGILAATALGFVHPDVHYALDQWADFLRKLNDSYVPENLRVSDLFGLLGKLHIHPALVVDKITRGLASLAVLLFCWWKFRRGQNPRASWALWVGSCIVLTLFNPRAETNSYVLISPLLAWVACGHLLNSRDNPLPGWILVVACVGLMCDGMGLAVYRATDVWLKPLIVLIVSPLVLFMPDSWKPKA